MKLTFKHKLIACICSYVMIMTACITGLVIVNNNARAADDVAFVGWSSWSLVQTSGFYKTYCTNNGNFVMPVDRIVKVYDNRDLGAISFLTHQPSSGSIPVQETFKGIKIEIWGNDSDLNLEGRQWLPISSDFQGSIDGRGHRISGLSQFSQGAKGLPKFHSFEEDGTLVITDNASAALIDGLTDAAVTIENLTVAGDIKTSPYEEQTKKIRGMKTTSLTRYKMADYVPAALYGQPTGANLLVSYDVDGAINPNLVEHSMTDMNATVSRGWTVAGFVNYITKDTKITFQNCINEVNITSIKAGSSSNITADDVSNAFGFLASTNAGSMDEANLPTDTELITEMTDASAGVYFINCINKGIFNMHKPLLGCAGLAASATVVKECANEGSISAAAGNIGGLVLGSNERDIYIRGSYNSATARLSLGRLEEERREGGIVAGIIVGHTRISQTGADITIRDCANYGSIESNTLARTSVSGIVGQFYSGLASGRLLIQNCSNVGNIGFMAAVGSLDANTLNYGSGIVARVRGRGAVEIEVVYTSAIQQLGGRGGAIIDGISSERTDFGAISIWGALHSTKGNTSPAPISNAYITDGLSKTEFLEMGNYTNYATVSATGRIENRSDRWTVPDMYNLGNMKYEPPPEGGNADLRGAMDSLSKIMAGTSVNIQGGYTPLRWFFPTTETKEALVSDDLMYLEMSRLIIYEYSGSGYNDIGPTANEKAKVQITFEHDVPNPKEEGDKYFQGYGYTNAENEVPIEKGKMSTIIMVFGETKLYQKWSITSKGIVYKYPNLADAVWSTSTAAYANLVVFEDDNGATITPPIDYTQGDKEYRTVLPRPKIEGFPEYKFAGWYYGDHGPLITEITPDMSGLVTLYGIFVENAQYEIVYDPYWGRWHGGSYRTPETLIYSSMDRYELGRFIRPERRGFEDDFAFEGWYYDTSYSGDPVTVIDGSQVATEKVYLFAKWRNLRTGEIVGWESPEARAPLGFFGMIMNFLESIFGDATIGLIIIGATIIMLIVIIRLFSGRKKSTGQQSQNATQILTELLIKQQVAAQGTNAFPGMGPSTMQMPGQFAAQYPPPPPYGGGYPPPPPFVDMAPPPPFEPSPFADMPPFDPGAFGDAPPPPPPL